MHFKSTIPCDLMAYFYESIVKLFMDIKSSINDEQAGTAGSL